jgi:hypothetical protein
VREAHVQLTCRWYTFRVRSLLLADASNQWERFPSVDYWKFIDNMRYLSGRLGTKGVDLPSQCLVISVLARSSKFRGDEWSRTQYEIGVKAHTGDGRNAPLSNCVGE